MSETSKTGVGKSVTSLDVSPQFEAYSGVEIIVNDDITYFSGNQTGRILSIQNPWGTQAQADAILSALKAKGFQYQPYTAEGAILNPAAEIGDGITISDTYSGLYKIDRKYSPLMSADIEAPQDEELDHEYPYEPKQDRIYKREIAEANAQISLNANAITAEVTNRTNADNNLNTTLTSKINQTANEINASVATVTSNKLDHTRTNETFGWSLTSSAFKINASGNTNVFTATKDGIKIQGDATVTGKIEAKSGFIGENAAKGFTIRGTGISWGAVNESGDDLAKDEDGNFVGGVFISKNRIRLGNNFVVNSIGKVTAKDLTITGGSISIKDGNGNVAFRVTDKGAVRATNLELVGGSINLKDSDGNTAFKVTTSGNVTANNMKLTGTLTVGSSTITADALRIGAMDGYNWSNGEYGGTGMTAASYSLGGASGGYGFNNATTYGSPSYPGYFRASTIWCDGGLAYQGGYILSGATTVYTGFTVTIGGRTYTCQGNPYSFARVATVRTEYE